MAKRLVRMIVGGGAVALALSGCGSAAHSTSGAARSRPGTVHTRAGRSPRRISTAVASPPGVSAWTAYHHDQDRTAAVEAGPSFAHAEKAWTADLGGVVHGQVVAADGRVFAATEDNRLVALDPHDGKVLWSRSLGKPLTNVDAVAGCGDIDPLGITSTPVIDTATSTIYVVGEISTGGSTVHHQLEGLSLTTGKVLVSDDVDPPLPAGEHAVNLLQRASLALADGRVYVSYGGNDGDCGHYHGWVVGVDDTGAAHEVSFEVASDGEGGAIWEAGGAPAVGGSGNVYVTTGNANPDPPEGGPDPKKYTESVVKLSPTLVPLASYKDEVAGGDEDLATGNPVLLPGGEVFAIGKTDIGYILRQSDLSEVASIPGVCGSDPDGGPAFQAATDRMFVPCRDGGIQVLNLRTHTVGRKLQGANGAPILIGDDVWAAQYPNGTVSEYDSRTGTAPLETIAVGQSVATFTSPSTALGLLLVPTNTGVTAYEGSAGVPPSPGT